jgi:hypothetical protein
MSLIFDLYIFILIRCQYSIAMIVVATLVQDMVWAHDIASYRYE